jgi:hypothetical protein
MNPRGIAGETHRWNDATTNTIPVDSVLIDGIVIVDCTAKQRVR